MRKPKLRMAELAKSMGMASQPESNEADKTETQKAVKTAKRGAAPRTPRLRVERGAAPSSGPLKQMTVKLDPEVRTRLLQESIRRKGENADNWPIQAIITEAVNAYLGGK
jgi:hypothetical protein